VLALLFLLAIRCSIAIVAGSACSWQQVRFDRCSTDLAPAVMQRADYHASLSAEEREVTTEEAKKLAVSWHAQVCFATFGCKTCWCFCCNPARHVRLQHAALNVDACLFRSALQYIEASAKTGKNVDALFELLCAEVKKATPVKEEKKKSKWRCTIL
jgi:hypothetical protein